MRWIAKQDLEKGDKKTVKHFAWFPVKIWINPAGDEAAQSIEHWVWLESYYADYVFIHYYYGDWYGAELWKETRRYVK